LKVYQEDKPMLVLSRKLGERLVIADTIVVTVTQIDRGRVRLGIEAPPDVRVVREELQTQGLSSQSSVASVGARG
jgi:carbon storage regulator